MTNTTMNSVNSPKKRTILPRLKALLFRYPAIPLFLVLVSITRPYYYADTYEYAHTTMLQETGKNPSMFMDSGHILWRPIALLLHNLLKPVLASLVGDNSFAQLSAVLIFMVFTMAIM